MPRKKDAFDESALKNNMSFMTYYSKFKDMGLSAFKWENLPEGLTGGEIERSFWYHPLQAFFYDDILERYLILPAGIQGVLTPMGEPTNVNATSHYSEYHALLSYGDYVPMWGNYSRKPTRDYIRLLSLRLANIERIIDVNVNGQKTPGVIQCDENQRLTLLNLYKEYDGNAPFIFASKNIDLKALTYISTGAPYISDKLYELKERYWNEGLTYLGIPNVSYQKRERMVSDEVNRGQGGALAMRYSRLAAREDAVDAINSKYGLNIKLSFRDFDRREDSHYEQIYDGSQIYL